MVNKEFFAALEDLEAEKGISSEIFLEALRGALVAAYKKQYENGAGEVDIRINPEKNSICISVASIATARYGSTDTRPVTVRTDMFPSFMISPLT